MSLFTGDGRVGRLTYFLTNLAIGVVWVVVVLALTGRDPLTGADEVSPLIIVAFPVVLWASVGNMMRRLHDRGHSGWMWLLSLVPVVGFALALYLLFAPGDERANRFGPPPGGVDERRLDDQRQAIEELQARVDRARSSAEGAYVREDGSYNMDWMTESVPGLGPASASDPGPPR